MVQGVIICFVLFPIHPGNPFMKLKLDKCKRNLMIIVLCLGLWPPEILYLNNFFTLLFLEGRHMSREYFEILIQCSVSADQRTQAFNMMIGVLPHTTLYLCWHASCLLSLSRLVLHCFLRSDTIISFTWSIIKYRPRLLVN